MNYEEALNFLNEIPMFSSRGAAAANFDLSRMHRFCGELGNPHLNFPSVLVAGTNGKGTVCRMLASVFDEAGYKTGLYTSPHLLDVRERFHLNCDRMNKELFASFFSNFAPYIRENRFTYFEVTTALAFWWFSSEKADLAIVEVGLGGRLDATNILHPLVSVITSVGLDHMDVLGDTIGQIAREKAGIIKPNGTVVTGPLNEEAESAVKNVANERSASLTVLKDEWQIEPENQWSSEKELLEDTGIVKRTDLIDKAIVREVVNKSSENFSVSEEEFKAGIKKWRQKFPAHGSFERLAGNRRWFYDGAHNENATLELVNHLKRIAQPDKWHVILSFMKDKLTDDVAQKWREFPNIYLYEMDQERAAQKEQMNYFFADGKMLQDHKAPVELLKGLETGLVIFSGSFYFYSVVKNWMGTLTSADQFNPPTQSI